MSSLLDLTKSQISYYTVHHPSQPSISMFIYLTVSQVPAAMLLAYAPHVYASIKAGKNHDRANPRKTTEHLAKDDSIDKVVSTPLGLTTPTSCLLE